MSNRYEKLVSRGSVQRDETRSKRASWDDKSNLLSLSEENVEME